jgi:hypothetical protein
MGCRVLVLSALLTVFRPACEKGDHGQECPHGESLNNSAPSDILPVDIIRLRVTVSVCLLQLTRWRSFATPFNGIRPPSVMTTAAREVKIIAASLSAQLLGRRLPLIPLNPFQAALSAVAVENGISVGMRGPADRPMERTPPPRPPCDRCLVPPDDVG